MLRYKLHHGLLQVVVEEVYELAGSETNILAD